nr:MAG TPA: HSR domain protein [Caudoviricetes sp.]
MLSCAFNDVNLCRYPNSLKHLKQLLYISYP